MILVDTSVWIDHLHQVEPRLQQLLDDDDVVVHDGVLGELALGLLRQRHVILESLAALHRATVMSSDELLGFVDSARLWGRGLGVIDVHLLGSALLGRSAIWTRDKRLRAAAVELGIDVVASDE